MNNSNQVPQMNYEDNLAFSNAFLAAHNKKRKLHGASQLNLSQELCEQAQEWADRIAKKRHMSYCELPGIGENITYFPLTTTPEEMVDFWYSENKKYEFETPGWQAGTNYFTQVIWHSTRELGVGRAFVQKHPLSLHLNCTIKNEAKQVVVAFYRPSGNSNRAGQFAVNVYKPVKQ